MGGPQAASHSLALSVPPPSRPVPTPRFPERRQPVPVPRTRLEGPIQLTPRRASSTMSLVRPVSETPAAASVEGKSGPLCWHCREPGHFRDYPEVPLSVPDRAGKYYIPVRVRGNTYQALVDSSCNQTSIHQCLMQPGALNTSRMVKVRCVHGDIRRYPIALVTIQLGDQNHS